MTEEQVTRTLLNWLESNSWKIISYDFPQSGTGVVLHPNREFRTTKNKGSFIPDIVAYKSPIVVFFENKDRFVLDDFEKVDNLRSTKNYSGSIEKHLEGIDYKKIYYGTGLGYSVRNEINVDLHLEKTDFVIFCMNESLVKIKYDPNNIFLGSTLTF